MAQAVVDQNPSETKQFMTQVEKVEELIGIYKAEARFLDYLYNLEIESAQREIRFIIDFVNNDSRNKAMNGLKNYFITLSGIIARHIEKKYGSAERAYSFNLKCIRLIEEKLTNENHRNIADEIIEFYQYIIADKKSVMSMHHTVNKVVEYIDEAIESPMSVEGLAQKFEVSTSHLSRIFREHTGITLVEYINIKKVEESQYHLRFSEEKISDISNYFNFCNQSYYTRIFKKYTGETPRRFRNDLTDNYFRFTLR